MQNYRPKVISMCFQNRFIMYVLIFTSWWIFLQRERNDILAMDQTRGSAWEKTALSNTWGIRNLQVKKKKKLKHETRIRPGYLGKEENWVEEIKLILNDCRWREKGSVPGWGDTGFWQSSKQCWAAFTQHQNRNSPWLCPSFLSHSQFVREALNDEVKVKVVVGKSPSQLRDRNVPLGLDCFSIQSWHLRRKIPSWLQKQHKCFAKTKNKLVFFLKNNNNPTSSQSISFTQL